MKESKPEIFIIEKSNIRSWFCILVFGLIGFIGLAAFYDSSSNIDGRDLFCLVFGLGFMSAAFLTWRYLFKPYCVISDRDFKVQRFVGSITIPYLEISCLEIYSKTFRPKRPGGGSMSHTLTTHHLLVTMRNGKEKNIALPSFGNNERLLSALA